MFGHSWIPMRAAWRKHSSEHAPLPSPHETPASLSCFIQCRRRGCSLQIYSIVDGTPASVVRALTKTIDCGHQSILARSSSSRPGVQQGNDITLA
jgi:hypothetical protein